MPGPEQLQSSSSPPNEKEVLEVTKNSPKAQIDTSSSKAVAATTSCSPSTDATSKADDTPAASAAVQFEAPNPMSKNQIRKRKRYERAMEKKRLKKQQKKDVKNAKAKAEGRDIEAERKFQAERAATGEGKKRRDEKWQKHMESAKDTFQICIDCGFEDQMNFKEQNSLASQLRYCYAQNKRSENPVFMSVSGMSETGNTFSQLKKVNGFPEQWLSRAFSHSSEPLEKMHGVVVGSGGDDDDGEKSAPTIDTSKIVYLTSDSGNILEHLDDSKVYVIGGIVDRNRLKGTTMKKAQELGITTAKLPIEQYLKLVATKVLTVNHVFEILLKYRTHGNDWKKAMLDVLPARKDITEVDADADAKGEKKKDE